MVLSDPKTRMEDIPYTRSADHSLLPRECLSSARDGQPRVCQGHVSILSGQLWEGSHGFSQMAVDKRIPGQAVCDTGRRASFCRGQKADTETSSENALTGVNRFRQASTHLCAC